MQGTYHAQTPVLDLQEGIFILEKPAHPYYIAGQLAQIAGQLLSLQFYNDLDHISLNRQIRRELLQAFQTYIALHVADFGEMRSLGVLQEVLS